MIRRCPFFIAALCLLVSISGCITYQTRPTMTTFEPYTDSAGAKMFKYEAKTNSLSYPEHTKEGEALRMEWLEEYLKDNKYCPDGYKILERKPVVRGGSLYGPLHIIYYTGVCIDKTTGK